MSASSTRRPKVLRRLRAEAERAATRSLPLEAAVLALTDAVNGLRLKTGHLDTNSGTIHSDLPPEESVRYIEDVFTDYKHYGGFDHFRGATAELGPGDSAGVGLLIREDGGEHVDLVDRYRSRYDPEQQHQIYAALGNRHDLEPFRESDDRDSSSFSGIAWHYGVPAEEYFREIGSLQYDFIVSRAVMEHLYDPLGALRDMVSSLAPGGLILHKIDMRDHGYFSREHDELTWLRFPSWLWRLMTRNSGRPCRVLAHDYRAALDRIRATDQIEYSLLVTHVVGAGEIVPHVEFEDIRQAQRDEALGVVNKARPTFASEFRDVSSEDLAISGVFLVVRKLGDSRDAVA